MCICFIYIYIFVLGACVFELVDCFETKVVTRSLTQPCVQRSGACRDLVDGGLNLEFPGMELSKNSCLIV